MAPNLPAALGEPTWMIGTASDHEQLFLSSLAYIDRVVEAIARRHALDRSEAEEFGAWAKARMIDGNYAVFRKFGGRSAINTYLTVVLVNLYRDYRNSRWGRWRPSAAAKRLGPTAVRLEQLIYRDGLPVREAVNIVRHVQPALDERELTRLAKSLPPHYQACEVDFSVVREDERVAITPPADAGVMAPIAEIERTLAELLAGLPAEDSLILRMRYWSGLTVAEIARTLHLDQKALYRRLESLQSRLRRVLEARGIDRERAVEALGAVYDS